MSTPDDKQVTIDYLRNELHMQQQINRQLTKINAILQTAILEHVHYLRQLAQSRNEHDRAVIDRVIEKALEHCK